MADRSRPSYVEMPKITVPTSAVGDTRAYRARIASSPTDQLIREVEAVAGAPSAKKVNDIISTYNTSGLKGLATEIGQKLADTGGKILYGQDYEAPDISSLSLGNSGYSYGSGGSGGSVGSSGASPDMQSYIDMINKTTAENNAWAAAQAQKQMDFQREMSDTAHQREVKDLIAAGLNPILSASGGNGAAALSGAMAQPDTSNTRLLAEMSLGSVEALGNSAVNLASGIRSKASNNFANQLLNVATKYVVPTLAKGAATALSKGLFH